MLDQTTGCNCFVQSQRPGAVSGPSVTNYFDDAGCSPFPTPTIPPYPPTRYPPHPLRPPLRERPAGGRPLRGWGGAALLRAGSVLARAGLLRFRSAWLAGRALSGGGRCGSGEGDAPPALARSGVRRGRGKAPRPRRMRANCGKLTRSRKSGPIALPLRARSSPPHRAVIAHALPTHPSVMGTA